MKYKVLLFVKNNETVFMNVVCCIFFYSALRINTEDTATIRSTEILARARVGRLQTS